MFGNRSFLVLGGDAADIVSLVKGGLEILSYNFSFRQGFDRKGQASTRVHGGTINLTLAQLPPQNIIRWGIESRRYENGTIILLDGENMPVEKVMFENAVCTGLEVNFTEGGDSYASTKLIIQAEVITVGDGIEFLSEWTSR